MFCLLLSACLVAGALGIIGGNSTTIDQFPHQVAIRHFNRSICGGAIVNRRAVLTAAHCTDDLSAKYMKVRAGSNSKHEGGQFIQVKEIIQHEQYNALIKDYDISILKLEEPLEFGPNVKAIALQDSNQDVRAGTIAVISGWGATVQNHRTTPSTLRTVAVEVISKQDCIHQYKQNPLTERMFCATSDKKDSCKGDSGGPLIAEHRLIGLVSWGRGCGKTKFPGVYTKISALRSWIDEHSGP